MSDPLDLVRDLAPGGEHRPELVERVRTDLMATIDGTTPAGGPLAEPTPIGWRRRRWLVPATAALVLTTAAAAWAVNRPISESTALECRHTGGSAIIDAVTGDPVLDCSNEWWRANGTEPPAMVAYDNGSGGVTVLLATDTAPEGYSELKPGRSLDPSLIHLEAALDDVAGGLSSGCYDETTARDITRNDLDRFGFANWTITVDEARRPDGESLCAYFILDPTMQQVELIGMTASAPGANPFQPYAKELAEELEATCLSLDTAASLARALAVETRVTIDGTSIEFTEQAGMLVINEVEDPAADCALSTVNVGGQVVVTLRGPRS